MLARARIGGAPLPEHELLSDCLLLVGGGSETTCNALSGGLRAFLERPSRLRHRRAYLPGRAPRADGDPQRPARAGAAPRARRAGRPLRTPGLELSRRREEASRSVPLRVRPTLCRRDDGCAFSEPVCPEIIEPFPSGTRPTSAPGSPIVDEESVSYRAAAPSRMHLAIWLLLGFASSGEMTAP